MSRRGLLLLVLVALLPGAAWAGPSEISALEQQRLLLERHRARLESLLDEQSRRVARLKEQSAGVGRDYQLQAALRESQTLASKLTALRVQLRAATEKLRSEYADAAKHASTDVERARYLKLGAQLEKPGQDTRIVTRERARRLDSPEDLDEKADLLADSEEKVRRQLRQVEVKLAQLENRARVRRHGKALDDNPFVEESARRTGQARRTTSPTANAAGATTAGDAAESGGRTTPPGAKTQTPPSPTADDPSDFAAASGASGTSNGVTAKAPAAPDGWGRSGSEVIISIRDVMDPAILKDPKLGGKDLDLKGHINALRKASAKLRQVAGGLSHQAKDLRQRARSLRTQK